MFIISFLTICDSHLLADLLMYYGSLYFTLTRGHSVGFQP